MDWICYCKEKQDTGSQKQGNQESQSIRSTQEVFKTDGWQEQDPETRRKPPNDVKDPQCFQVLQSATPFYKDTAQNRRRNYPHYAWRQWPHK